MDDRPTTPADGAGPKAPTVDALLAQLCDPDPQVRRDAMLKLGEAAGAHASCESAAHALPALQAAAARDPAPACRKAALAALRRAGDRARFNAAVRRALHDDDPLVRLDAAWQVRQAGPPNPAIVDALVRAAEREAELPVVFGMVAGALGSLADPRAFRPLVAYLASPDGYRRAAAAQALGTLGDPRAITHLTPLLDDRAAAWQEDHGPARTVADVARAALRRLGVS